MSRYFPATVMGGRLYVQGMLRRSDEREEPLQKPSVGRHMQRLVNDRRADTEACPERPFESVSRRKARGQPCGWLPRDSSGSARSRSECGYFAGAWAGVVTGFPD
jgi:hypothetical protein